MQQDVQINQVKVSERLVYTSFAEIVEGRVDTLHLGLKDQDAARRECVWDDDLSERLISVNALLGNKVGNLLQRGWETAEGGRVDWDLV